MNEREKPPLLILTGPTAVGKTELSIRLAKKIGGEIISADSMQVYRHMDIGSAKISKEEMDGVPHHLIDILEPDQEFHVAMFQAMAKKVLAEIYSRKKIPILVGGTGFYIQALLYDIEFKENTADRQIRHELEQLVLKEGEQGRQTLYQMLKELDPEAADQIHANNVKRVIRAIEYYKETGEKISLHNDEMHRRESPYHFLYYVLSTDRSLLYERIEKRVDQMLTLGLVDEVRRLQSLGCRRNMTSMQGLGYKEILDYLNHECSLEEAVAILKRDTRRFAKRQLTWFRREKEVHWLHLPDFENNLSLVLQKILEDCETNRIVLQ